MSVSPRHSRSPSDSVERPAKDDSADSREGSAGPPTRIPKPQHLHLPKKGILKRSGSAHSQLSLLSDGGDTLTPLRSEAARRYTPPRAPPPDADAPDKSRIPKLSVSWWETSSVCGEAPRHHGDISDDDDMSSVGSSSIAGTWWFGRSTKYVPHCQRRHLHLDEENEYLTPTQRKNREIAELRKKLRQSLQLAEDKDKHLVSLRERLTELETMMENDSGLSETHKLMTQLKRMEEQCEREKKELSDQFEQKVKQLKKELERERVWTTNHQSRIRRTNSSDSDEDHMSMYMSSGISSSPRHLKAAPVEESDAVIGVTQVIDTQARKPVKRPKVVNHVGTNTNVIQYDFTNGDCAAVNLLQQELHGYQNECVLLKNRLHEMEYAIKQFQADFVSETCHKPVCLAKKHEMTNQILAYKDECVVWREKSAQLEILLKQQKNLDSEIYPQQFISKAIETTLQSAANETQFQSYSDNQVLEINEKNEVISDLETKLKEEMAENSELTKKLQAKLEADEVKLSKSELLSENLKLSEKIQTLELELTDKESMMSTNEQVLHHLEQELAAKTAEFEAVKLTAKRLYEKNDNMQKENVDLEEEIVSLINTLQAEGIIVKNRRSSVVGGEILTQIAYKTTGVATDLSKEMITVLESTNVELGEKLTELQNYHEKKVSELQSCLNELSENLSLKNGLVATLTDRIQCITNEYEAARETMDKERKSYVDRLEEISAVANSVPILKRELEIVREDLRSVEQVQRLERSKFEQAFESSIADGMQAQKTTVDYWKQKLQSSQAERNTYKSKAEKAEKKAADIKMKLSLEKSKLAHQLEGSYNEVSALTAKVYMPHEDKGVLAYPNTSDKIIMCLPINVSVSTSILKGDFYDEKEEKIKLAQGELKTTRKQVQVLQDKLLSTSSIKENLDDLSMKNQLLEIHVDELTKELESVKMEHDFHRDNLTTHLHEPEEKSANTKRSRDERSHIAQLENEFEAVRLELDKVIKKYELEKTQMKASLEALEAVVAERDVLKTEIVALQQHESNKLHRHAENIATIKEAINSENIESIKEAVQEFIENDYTSASKPSVNASSFPETICFDSPKEKQKAVAEFLLNRLKVEREQFFQVKEEQKMEVWDLALENKSLKSELAEKFAVPNILTQGSGSEPLLSTLWNVSSDNHKHEMATLRAKNLCLLRENLLLTNELCSLRETVGSVIEKHDSCISFTTGQPASTANFQLGVPAMDNHKSRAHSEVPTTGTDLTADLQAVRDDLEGILIHIDKATKSTSMASIVDKKDNENARKRENQLMYWLEKEINEEKQELDALAKWYEQDKKRLETNLDEFRSEAILTKCMLDRKELELSIVSREMELYRLEDVNRAGKRAKAESDIALIKWASDTDLTCARIGPQGVYKWKWKAGNLFCRVVKLEHDYQEAHKERTMLNEENIMIKGEIEVLRAERAAAKENENFRTSISKAEEQASHSKKEIDAAVWETLHMTNLYENPDRWKPGGPRAVPPLLKKPKSTPIETIKEMYEKQIHVLKIQLEDSRLSCKRAEQKADRLDKDKLNMDAALSSLKVTLNEDMMENAKLKAEISELYQKVKLTPVAVLSHSASEIQPDMLVKPTQLESSLPNAQFDDKMWNNEVSALQDKICCLESENTKLTMQISGILADAAISKETDNKGVQTVLEKFVEVCAEETPKAQISHLKLSLDKHTCENAKLFNKAKELQTRIDFLEAENAALTLSVEYSQSTVIEHAENNTQISLPEEKPQRVNDNYTINKSRLNSDQIFDKPDSDTTQLNTLINNLVLVLTESKVENVKLKNDTLHLLNKLESLQMENISLSSIATKIEHQHPTNAELLNLKNTLADCNMENVMLNDQLQKFEEKVSILEDRLAFESISNSQISCSTEVKIGKLKQDLVKFEQENSQLRQEILTLQQQICLLHNNKPVPSVLQVPDNLGESNMFEDVNADNKFVKSDNESGKPVLLVSTAVGIDKHEIGEGLSELYRKINYLEAENATLSLSLELLTPAPDVLEIAEVANKNNEELALQIEVCSLKANLDLCKSENYKLQAEVAELQNEISCLENQIAAFPNTHSLISTGTSFSNAETNESRPEHTETKLEVTEFEAGANKLLKDQSQLQEMEALIVEDVHISKELPSTSLNLSTATVYATPSRFPTILSHAIPTVHIPVVTEETCDSGMQSVCIGTDSEVVYSSPEILQECDYLGTVSVTTQSLQESTNQNSVTTISEWSMLEERVLTAEKELEMVSQELQLSKEVYSHQIQRLEAEKADLEHRLRQAALMSDVNQKESSPVTNTDLKTARNLQEKIDGLMIEMEQREKRHQDMYLAMFKKGQETAMVELSDRAGSTSDKLSELESQSQPQVHLRLHKDLDISWRKTSTLSDEEILLRFLRDAVYYYLIERDSKDHLQAIMNILKFSERQRQDVQKHKGI